MQKNNTKVDFSGQDIYVGLDTGKKSWKAGVKQITAMIHV